MAAPPPPGLDVTISPDGILQVRRPAPAPARRPKRTPVTAVEELGLLLDGTLTALLRLEPAGDGSKLARIGLPPHRLHARAELIDSAGNKALPAAIPLIAHYQLQTGALALQGMEVRGSFRAAAWLAPAIGVELQGAGQSFGRAIARRGPAGTDGCASWQFSISLSRLPRLGPRTRLHLIAGGAELGGAHLDLGQEDLPYAGCVDGADATHIAGWAFDRGDPARKLLLELLVDGQRAAGISADRPREDLAALRLADTAHGFIAALPPAQNPTAIRQIGLRIAGTALELAGSPITIDPAPQRTGCFDRLHNTSAFGWATDYTNPEEKLLVEAITEAGEVVGQAIAGDFRGDLLRAGLAGGFCAFKIDFGHAYERILGQKLFVRIKDGGQILQGSPRPVAQNPNFARLKSRRQAIPPGVLPRLTRALNFRTHGAALSLLMPVHNPTRKFLIEALESVRHQFCDAWELICIDDASTLPHVQEILQRYAAADPRIRVLHSQENIGIARATNLGLRAARHPFVAFMDHDDALEPDAVWQVLAAAAQTDADILYSDEVLTGEDINDFIECRLRPAFSHDYYLSHPYFVHLVSVRTALARQIGGLDEGMNISADIDFVLRVIERARTITHIPAILYRWRTHTRSTGHARQDEVMAATAAAITRHLARLGLPATVSPGVWFNQFTLHWPDPGGRVLVVIPTRNKVELLQKAIDSIERTTPADQLRIVVIDHQSDDPATRAYLNDIAARHHIMPYHGPFNFSAMNNQAVARHGQDCPFILFLNNDVEATSPGWVERLRSLAARPDIGAVGPLLMYADNRVQHGGVFLGFNNSAEHALKFQDVWLDTQGRRNLGYNCSLSSVRDFSAVTAACMMLRRDVFDRVGGFDESFAVGFNDTDLCLRIGALGLRILYDGTTLLYHYESATRADTRQVLHPEDTQRMVDRWGALVAAGDPWYNPLLSLVAQDHVPREDAAVKPRNRPRPRPGPAMPAASLPAARADGAPPAARLKPRAPRASLGHGRDTPLPPQRTRRKSA